MGFDPAIRAKVRKLALDKKSKLTARDVLMSEELKKPREKTSLNVGFCIPKTVLPTAMLISRSHGNSQTQPRYDR